MQATSCVKLVKDIDINCYFLEHSFVNSRTLAELSYQVKNKFLPEYSDVVLLATCQRIELYCKTLNKDPILDIFGFRGQCINGYLDVYHRLVQIGCGLRSQILGEKFIYTQLKNTIDSVPKDHPIHSIGFSALDLSQKLRKKHSFYASADYEEITFNLLNTQASKQSNSVLLVIGGGHLAQAIAKRALSNYSRVVIITREAKRLRKVFLNEPLMEIYSINTLQSSLLALPFHCFIATTNLNDEYHTSLLKIINHSNCQAIVDMSSVPMFSEYISKKNCYTTMYDNSYLEIIETTNLLLSFRISDLLSDIENYNPFV